MARHFSSTFGTMLALACCVVLATGCGSSKQKATTPKTQAKMVSNKPGSTEGGSQPTESEEQLRGNNSAADQENWTDKSNQSGISPDKNTVEKGAEKKKESLVKPAKKQIKRDRRSSPTPSTSMSADLGQELKEESQNPKTPATNGAIERVVNKNFAPEVHDRFEEIRNSAEDSDSLIAEFESDRQSLPKWKEAHSAVVSVHGDAVAMKTDHPSYPRLPKLVLDLELKRDKLEQQKPGG